MPEPWPPARPQPRRRLAAGLQLEDLRVSHWERGVRLHDDPLTPFADQDARHPYRAFGAAPVADAPKALRPCNPALKVDAEVVGHQPETVTGNCCDGVGGL